MASSFDPGTGGSLVSTNIPAAFAEMSLLLVQAELAVNADARPDNITMTSDADAGTMTINATLPISTSLNSSGQTLTSATDYFAALIASGGDSTFSNGSGELQSTNKVTAFFELAQILHAAEKASTLDPQPDNIQITNDQEAETSTIAATLPLALSANASGQIVTEAVDYL